ncbi:hypothetical protein ACT1UG_27350 [Bacillus paramycoides]|uniref:hypothetical protein n=1 Tax=Bacillus paramycoides TaxID=2026194 RepID=UPI0040594561
MTEKEENVHIRIVDEDGNVHYKFDIEEEDLEDYLVNYPNMRFLSENLYEMVEDEEGLENLKEEIEEIKELLGMVRTTEIIETKPKTKEKKKRKRKRILLTFIGIIIFCLGWKAVEGYSEYYRVQNGKQVEGKVEIKLQTNQSSLYPTNELYISADHKYNAVLVEQEVFDRVKRGDTFKVIIYKDKIYLDPREEKTKVD